VKAYILTGLIITIVSTAVFGSSCSEKYTAQESENIARTFLVKSPTFQFSGVPGSVRLLESEEGTLPNSWQFTYEFVSERSGYGDRTGMDTSRETGTYEAEITVWEHKVVRAVINEHWDELCLNFTNEPI
jgi:hypothetical protein